MSTRKIVAFLPCRKGSQRVPDKNIRSFGGVKNGLFEIKLSQLLSVNYIDEIVLSTNDLRLIDLAKERNSPKIIIDKRSDHLSSSTTSTDDLIRYIPKLISGSDTHVLWTHVTSPFLTEKKYDVAIKDYFEALKHGYDSMMSVTKIQKFLWNKSGPINYNREKEKWPRTQTIDPVYEINSGFFLNPLENYRMYWDRVGKNPKLFELDVQESFDIDWEEDFKMGEIMWKQNEI
ncbi:MAG: acylneuraminate cytidylyltransferase family protein [Cyclobacteriaceae bacterium]